MTDLERARRVFGNVGFAMGLTGCVIEEVGSGFARCSLKIEDKHRNGLGHVMGGAIYTLVDMAYAVASNFDRDVFVTTSSSIYFLRSADNGTITATARQIRAGRQTCLFEVEVRDETGREIAHASVGGTKIDPKKSPLGRSIRDAFQDKQDQCPQDR